MYQSLVEEKVRLVRETPAEPFGQQRHLTLKSVFEEVGEKCVYGVDGRCMAPRVCVALMSLAATYVDDADVEGSECDKLYTIHFKVNPWFFFCPPLGRQFIHYLCLEIYLKQVGC